MKSIKASISTRLAALLFGAALFGLVSQSALALTASGTSITNQASLAYSVGGVGQTAIPSNIVSFLVDEKINLTVTGGITTSVVPGSTAQATAFTVTNLSNSALDFNLAVTSVISGDNFDPTACSAFVENGVTGGYQPAQDTATFIDELGAGLSATVYAVCSIPVGATNTQTGLVGLTATARGTFTGPNGTYVATGGSVGALINQTVVADTAGSVDIVFADGAGTEDAARDAAHSAHNTYLVATAALTVSKTGVALCDPSNATSTPKSIPGGITQWTITISNGAAGAPATLTSITDTLANVAATVMDPGQAAGITVPTAVAATCAPGPGPYGFKVTVPVARVLGGSLAGSGTTSYFTTTSTADGIDFASPLITATFATILPIDGATGHATAGLLNAGESVTIIFNTVMQ
jgi:hypothetical protein